MGKDAVGTRRHNDCRKRRCPHHGRISRYRKGPVSFATCIPAHLNKASKNNRRKSVSEYREKQKGEVLIIDDEPSVADALKMILEDSGYRVSTALTGRDGIEKARRGQFCLTITDLNLTDMTGFDVISAICRDKPQSLFIIITSSGSQDVMAEVRSCGAAAGFLLKPFLPSEILQLITVTLANQRSSGDGEAFAGLPEYPLNL